MSRTSIQGQGRGRGQIFKDKDKDEDKILVSRPTCPRGLNITAFIPAVDESTVI